MPGIYPGHDPIGMAYVAGETAFAQLFTESVAADPWPVLLARVQRMHRADLRAVITTALMSHVDPRAVSVWLTLLKQRLAEGPDRSPGVVDPDEDDRALALASLLALRAGR